MKIPLQMTLLNPFDDEKVAQMTLEEDKTKKRDLLVIDVLFGSIRFEAELMRPSQQEGADAITENRLKRWDMLKKIKVLRKEKTLVATFDADETKDCIDMVVKNVGMDIDLVGQVRDIFDDKCSRASKYVAENYKEPKVVPIKKK